MRRTMRATPTRRIPKRMGLPVSGDTISETANSYLEPVFVVEAPPELPRFGDDYRLTGRTANGAEAFSLRFIMPETADGDGCSSFAFVLPVQPGWEGNLASITLTRPDGSMTLDGAATSRWPSSATFAPGRFAASSATRYPPCRRLRTRSGNPAGQGSKCYSAKEFRAGRLIRLVDGSIEEDVVRGG